MVPNHEFCDQRQSNWFLSTIQVLQIRSLHIQILIPTHDYVQSIIRQQTTVR